MIQWNSKFSDSETYREALIRLLNDQKFTGKFKNGYGLLETLAEFFGTTRLAVHSVMKRLRKEGKIGSFSPGHKKVSVIIDDLKNINENEKTQDFLDFIIRGTDLIHKYDIRQTEVFPEYNFPGWVGVVNAGDWHLDHYKTDQKQLIEDLKLIGQEPHLFYVFAGDTIDVLNLRFPELENETINIPHRRLIEVVKYLFSFLPNTLALILGCHDNWMKTRGRRDILEEIRNTISGYYLGYGGTINFKVGSVVYRIAAWHKYGMESALNHFSPNYNYLRKFDADADVITIAHRHDIVGIQQVYWQGKSKIFVRSGSPQYRTEYAWKEGFRGAIHRWPMYLLNGTEKRMIAVNNFREGLPILRALNSGIKFPAASGVDISLQRRDEEFYLSAKEKVQVQVEKMTEDIKRKSQTLDFLIKYQENDGIEK